MRPGSEPAAVRVSGLSKSFGATHAVADLSFAVAPGTITGFLGPNGAGKTTTFRALLGLVRPDEGEATILGRPYASLAHPAGVVGAHLEGSGFHPGRTGRAQLRLQARSAGLGPGLVDPALALVGLEHAARWKVGRYSAGMKQRLGLAAALLGSPQVLLLDEPANGLDPEGIRWLRGFLRALTRRGTTILMASHVLAEVALTVDEVVIIDRGRLVTQAPVALLTRYGERVLVRTPSADHLAAGLRGRDATVAVDGDLVRVAGLPIEAVGSLAAELGVVLHELRHESVTLEEAFLNMTRGAP